MLGELQLAHLDLAVGAIHNPGVTGVVKSWQLQPLKKCLKLRGWEKKRAEMLVQKKQPLKRTKKTNNDVDSNMFRKAKGLVARFFSHCFT